MGANNQVATYHAKLGERVRLSWKVRLISILSENQFAFDGIEAVVIDEVGKTYDRLVTEIETKAYDATHNYVEKYKTDHNGESPRYLTGSGHFKSWRGSYIDGILDGIEKSLAKQPVFA